MVGLGETFFSAYILALDGGEIAAGLVMALPLLVGAVLQLAGPALLHRRIAYQPWIVWTAMLQGASLFVMPLAPWAGRFAVPVAFAAATVYWTAGLSSGPAWNTWIEGIVPRSLRTRFFAFRVRVSQACILVGFLIGGFALQYGKTHHLSLELFTGIFVVSGACRLASAWFLGRHRECRRRRVMPRKMSLREWARNGRGTAGGKLLVYLFAVQIAVYLSGPYFAPFILSKLEIPYHHYALLIGLTFVGKVVALPAWGRLAHYASPHKLLWIGGLSIIPISGLWMVSQSLPFLAVLQFCGGVTWAAYELAIVLMFFESIPRDERTSVMTIYNFGNSLAQVAGALLGALWLYEFNRSFDSYLWLFVASSVGRAATILLLRRVPQVRPVDEKLTAAPSTRTSHPQPAAALPASTPPQMAPTVRNAS
ncbi:MAG: MFS transporter [Pirellulales bacterium]